MHQRFSVIYRIQSPSESYALETARDITLEQTVEVPPDCIPQEHYENGIIGCIESCRKVNDCSFDIEISFRSDITSYTVPQFLNVIYGNISLKKGIKIVDLRLSDDLTSVFKGPSWGIDGIRKLTGVYGRPLACTALKPMGLSSSELAQKASEFALGGIDLIKDDHGINDQIFHPFKERVERCIEAVEKANLQTGRRTLYLPSLAGTIENIEEQVEFAINCGIRGFLVVPMISGFDLIRILSSKYNLIVMAHPALTGSFFNSAHDGIAPEILLGMLMRLFGADISVYPNWGGRFPFTKQECIEIASSLRKPLSYKSSFPAPAGGMNLGRLDELAQNYGEDTVFLIGGALMQNTTDLCSRTEEFMNLIRSKFDERLEEPAGPFVSSCEIGSTEKSRIASILPVKDFRWEGRAPQEYKSDNQFTFKGVSRIELIGKSGEKTKFDLRYFELEPGGFSSFEKHVHEHVIIAAQGKGVLIKGNERFELEPNTIAYVGPLEPHQLRNESENIFGFYCIVDHDRDKPMQV